jgi:hypothetical protein
VVDAFFLRATTGTRRADTSEEGSRSGLGIHVRAPGGGTVGIFSDLFTRKEKPRPDFSGVRSGGSSTAPAPDVSGPEASATPVTAGRTYVVVSGDSLSRIAKREYGDAQQWPRIYEANRSLIKDPDLIFPGQELRIPAA